MNALTGEWVVVSPQRTQRPWDGQTGDVSRPALPEFDPDCYLCPGNTRAGGVTNPAYTDTFVFNNDYAAILPEQGLGVALKIEDGARRASECAVAALLVRLGVLEAGDPAVARRLTPPVTSRRGEVVGRIRPAEGFWAGGAPV